MPKIETVSLVLRIPTQLKERLDFFARKEQKKITHILLEALREYLDRRDG